jgi:SAM-dependent methyltransferase
MVSNIRSERVADYYDYAASYVPDFTVLNYGFSSDPENSMLPPDEPEFYCLRMYEHALAGVPLAGLEVIEISCGRGGGASFLMRQHRPKRYVAIDVSEENIRLARNRDAAPEFRVGDAEALDFPDVSFDVAINVESSHLYADRTRFFSEVHRVLRPGGRFCYADGCWADDDCTQELLDAGFLLQERLEITQNVIRSLRLDNARRNALFDAIPDDSLRLKCKDWGGVIGSRAYRRFAEGRRRYFSHTLLRPEDPTVTQQLIAPIT